MINVRNLKLVLLPAIVIIFWLLASFPATMSADSLHVWDQVVSRRFNDWHPVIYSLTVYIISLGGRFLPLVVLAQEILVFLTLYRVLKILFVNKNSASVLRYTSLIFVTPFFGGISVTLWKDVPYSCFTVLGLSFLYSGINEGIKSRIYQGFGLLTFGAMYRHDGAPTLIVVCLLLLLLKLFFKNSWRFFPTKLVFATALCAVFAYALSLSLVTLLQAEKNPSWMRTSMFLADLQYVNANNPEVLSPQVKSALDKISTGDSLEGSRFCENFNGMVFSAGFNPIEADKYSDKVVGYWLQEAKNGNLALLINAHLCRSKAFIPWPFSGPPVYKYWIHSGIDQPNSLGIEQREIIPLLSELKSLWLYAWQYNAELVAWPGGHITFLVLALSLLVRREGFAVSLGIFSVFAVARTAILIFGAPGQDFRLVFLVYLVSVPAIAKIASLIFQRKPSSVLKIR